ncbi:MAG: 30S ribosomal protein S20 [Nitrospirae bacterium]|nr:30S ribosomal protein S20 [Nitrospirota bacterium]
MANHESTKKDIRRNARRRERNRQAIMTMRTLARKVEEAVTAGKSDEAREALMRVVPFIDHAVNRGILHRNTASRKISRLTLKVNGVSASQG